MESNVSRLLVGHNLNRGDTGLQSNKASRVLCLIVICWATLVENDGRAGESQIVEDLKKKGSLVGITVFEGDSAPMVVIFDVHQDDSDLDGLCELTRLRALGLDGTRVSDLGVLNYISGLSGLKDLCISETDVSDKGLAKITKLTSLLRLTLAKTRITNEALRHVGGLKSLRVLDIENTRVTNEGLAELTRLDSLTILKLGGCSGITDDGIDSLIRIKGLTELSLKGASITPSGILRLRASLPRCRVSID